MKLLKTSQKLLLFAIVFLGIAVTILLVKQQQDLREKASVQDATAATVCSSGGTVDISVKYTNTTTAIVNVIARDMETGKETALGSVGPGDSVTGTINTGSQTIGQNIVLFEASNGDTKTVPFTARDCTGGVNYCAVNQAQCTWDELENTTQYKVTVRNTATGDIIRDGIVNHPTTNFVFPAAPGESYSCEVVPVNSCGEGEKADAEGTCPVLTPTEIPLTQTPVPSETPPSVSSSPTPPGFTGTPVPSNKPTNTPVPSGTPAPTNTPGPTNTYSPSNTPNPSVSVTKPPVQATTVPGRGGDVSNKSSNPTPTGLSALPPTGLTQDVMLITILGSGIVLLGAFVLIFLW